MFSSYLAERSGGPDGVDGVVQAEGGNDDVDHSDDEDEGDGGVVEDICVSLVRLIVDVQPCQNQQQDPHHNLQDGARLQ